MAEETTRSVAVVGVSALFPGSDTAEGFWRDILAGEDLVDEIPPERWLTEDYFDEDPAAEDKTYARRGAFLDDVPFDPMAYGIPPNAIEATDTSQLLALIVARQVLEDASGGQFREMDRERISVILGVTSGQELMNEMASRLQRPVWQKALRETGLPEDEVQEACDRIASHYVPWQESTFPGLLGNVVAGRIANRFDLGGTNCVTDAACASTLSALSMGLNELYLGDSDVVIAGGVDTFSDIFMYMCFSKTPALSKTGDARPFSNSADGTILGEGLAMFALKRLADAERDGDRIYGVIRGIGSSSDGRSKSIYAPLAEGQASALQRAYDKAGYGPDSVELIEAHGTGTKAGDAAEFSGLRQVFEATGRTDRQWCGIGSVKSQVGHTKAAAGSAGLFKALMALHHGVLPPTIKVERPNERLELEESPFYINTEARPWIRGSDHPRRAGVSAFGFGGSNFHVTVEEYTGDRSAPRFLQSPSHLVLLDGETASDVVERCEELVSAFHDGDSLTRLARESQESFDCGRHARLAVVASNAEDARKLLTQAADTIRANPDSDASLPTGIYYVSGDASEKLGDVAFLFPGQGAQYVNMGAELAMAFEAARAPWDRAADASFDDTPLHRVVFPPPAFDEDDREANEERLTRTEWAQPAIGVASASALALFELLELYPDAVGGHSYGEITALHAAGVLNTEDFLRVSRMRGELMAEAASSTTGTMSAVRCDPEELQELLDEWELDVVIANYNGPRQSVISGALETIEEAERRLDDARIAATRLNVATAFHSEIVSASTEPFADFLADIDFHAANVPVYSNSTAEVYPTGAKEARERLAAQIARPVRFMDEVRAMYDAGVRTFVEVGPGTILSRLTRRILRREDVSVVSVDGKGRDGLTSFWHALAQLAVRGADLSFAHLWDGIRRPEDPTDMEEPRLSVPISGANYDRPYPPSGGADALPEPNPARPSTPAPPQVSPSPQTDEGATMNRDDETMKQPEAATSAEEEVKPRSASAAVDPRWLEAFQESQRQMADAHAAYQQAMADSHVAFLRAVESSQTNLAAMMSGEAPPTDAPAPSAPSRETPAPRAPVSQAQAPQAQAPQRPAPVPSQRPAPTSASSDASATAPRRTISSATPSTAGETNDLRVILLDAVADKTGYPTEMLELDMKLEADLGIDSIKRVEILSALNETLPELPEVDGSQMAKLTTLGEILRFLETEMGAETTAASAPSSEPATPVNGENDSASLASADLETVLLDAVADKTGYPTEMLELDMKLEADLGIDSIKRVEILSAVNETLPELPEVDGSRMAKLTTLGEILSFMEDELGGLKKKPAAAE